MRRALTLACVVGLLFPSGAAAGEQQAAGPAHHLYHVTIGIQFPGATQSAVPNVEVNKFFPDTITIHAGDSIRFTNAVGAAPQTVTFGPLLNTPALFPSRTQAEVNPLISKPRGGTVVIDSSTNIYSSGALATGIPGLTASYTFSFPRVGTYPYRSLFHPGMLGQVVVVAPGAPASADPPDQSAALYDGLRSLVQALPVAQKDILNSADSSGGGTVYVGAGDNNISIQAFFSPSVVAELGATITWSLAETSGDPHALVFYRPTDTESAGRVPLYTGLAPDGGLKVNPAYWSATVPTGTTVITSTIQQAPDQRWTSGILYNGSVNYPSAVPTQYSLTLNHPGQYLFVDPFHPGMDGQVTVLP